MIIISDYTLVLKEDFGVFVESSENSHICPVCQGTLHYRDSRPRIRKKEGGTKEQLMIRRFRCQNCHAYHNELPDCLVPYKHYEAEVIAGVLDEVILPDDLDSEDYPSFSTMLRWLQWFRENLQRMEGYLRIDMYCTLPHLDRSETEQYIASHMDYSGCTQEVFTAKALDEIHKASAGIPRMVNRICEKALMYAFQNQKRLIDDYMIKFVIEHEMLGTITT